MNDLKLKVVNYFPLIMVLYFAIFLLFLASHKMSNIINLFNFTLVPIFFLFNPRLNRFFFLFLIFVSVTAVLSYVYTSNITIILALVTNFVAFMLLSTNEFRCLLNKIKLLNWLLIGFTFYFVFLTFIGSDFLIENIGVNRLYLPLLFFYSWLVCLIRIDKVKVFSLILFVMFCASFVVFSIALGARGLMISVFISLSGLFVHFFTRSSFLMIFVLIAFFFFGLDFSGDLSSLNSRFVIKSGDEESRFAIWSDFFHHFSGFLVFDRDLTPTLKVYVDNMHNIFLDIIVKGGVMGLCISLSLFFLMLGGVIRAALKRDFAVSFFGVLLLAKMNTDSVLFYGADVIFVYLFLYLSFISNEAFLGFKGKCYRLSI